MFHITKGRVSPETEKKLLYHKVQEPARTIDMVPKIANNPLLGTGKFSNAKYVSIFNKDELNRYDSNKTVITVSKQEILKGWINPESGFWRVPLVPK